MNWITDFDTGFGSFSNGFEDGRDYAVSYNYGLNENNIHPYSRWHLKHFEVDDDKKQFSNFFIGTPHLGNQISKRGRANIDINELNQCLTLISLKKPDTIILSILKNGFYFLNEFKNKVCYTVDGYPTKDYVVLMLKKMGYFIDRFIIDEANFGIPQHKEFVIYFAQKKDFDPIIKQVNRYRENKVPKPIDFLKTIAVMDGVYDYGYDMKYQDVCKKIAPGSNAKKTKDISQTSGYYRLRPDIPCNSLHHDFYRVSSRGPSIHPIDDRPLSIIEGAYLSGIYMNLWGLSGLDKKIVADMIARSIAPNVAWKIKKVVVENLV